MNEKNFNNIVIVTLFIVYISITCFFTIKNNIKIFKQETTRVQATEQYSEADVANKVVMLKNTYESIITSNLACKDDYIDIYGLFQKVLQKNIVEDAADGKRVIKLKNGNLAFIYPEADIEEWSQKIISVSEYTKKKDIYMLYADAPWRITDKSDLPFYLKDNVDKTDKKFVNELKEHDVNVLELKNVLEGKKDEWFFKTDHHWNIETAFNAYKAIMNNFKENVGLNVEEKYLNDYSKKVYDDIFLGTYGKRVGKYYGGVDDFAYILPKFNTKLDVINNRDWNKEESHLVGNFEKVFTYPKYLENTKLDRKMSTYYTYTEGIKAEIKINNLMADNEKKILILTDSFGEPVFPFISLNFKETRVIDVRRFKAIRLYTYIDKFNPDIILFIHTPTSLYDKSCVNFQLK